MGEVTQTACAQRPFNTKADRFEIYRQVIEEVSDSMRRGWPLMPVEIDYNSAFQCNVDPHYLECMFSHRSEVEEKPNG